MSWSRGLGRERTHNRQAEGWNPCWQRILDEIYFNELTKVAKWGTLKNIIKILLKVAIKALKKEYWSLQVLYCNKFH